MEYGTSLKFLLPVVIVTLLFEYSRSESVPISPCPTVFQYEQDRSGNWHGLLTAPNPHPYVALQITVSMYSTARIPEDKNAKLEPVNSNLWHALASGERNPIQYRLNFPLPSPLPTIKDIIVNQQHICTGTKPSSKVHTTITVQHEIFNQNCSSSSLQCPLNNINQLDGIPLVVPEQVVEVQCGKPVIKTNSLVVFGQNTRRGQWPWHAAIFYLTGYDTKYICGGSFIGRRSIITAAHCVTSNGKLLDYQQFLVHLGRYNLRDRKEQGAQEIDVSDILLHPAFDHTKLQGDLAIMILQTAVIITDFIRPVCLWDFREISLSSVVGKEGVVVGWGLDEDGLTAEQLKMVKKPIVDYQTCVMSDPTFFSQFASNTTLCAGYRNGSSVCNGDSGGGLVIPETDKDGQIRWVLRGIVSNSKPRDNVSKICDTKSYIVFTDIAQFLDWINVIYI